MGYPSGGSAYLDGGGAFSTRPFAEATQAEIDAEVRRILREAEHRAVGLLEEHRAVLDQLVAELVARETVDGAVVYRLAGRPMPSDGQATTVAPGRAAAAAAPPAPPATAPPGG